MVGFKERVFKYLWVILCLSIFLSPLQAKEDPGPIDLLSAAKNFLVALYSKNSQEFNRWVLPSPGSESLLAAQNVGGEELKKLKQEIESMRPVKEPRFSFNGDALSPDQIKSPPEGTKALLLLDFRGQLTVLTMVWNAGQWKVDPRFVLAEKAKPQPTDSAGVPKVFLFSLFRKDLKTLKDVVAPSDPATMKMLMRSNDYPGGDLDQLLNLALEMAVAPARVGEVFRMPSGEKKTAEAPTADSQIMVGLYGTAELPFEMKKIKGKWKVVAQPYIQMLQAGGYI